jgi:type IV pilus assembly protein PilB
MSKIFPNASFLSMQYRIPMIDLDEYEIESAIIGLVPRQLCETHRVLPVSRAGASLIVAMVDPTDKAAIGALTAHAGLTIEPVITTEPALMKAIARSYGRLN